MVESLPALPRDCVFCPLQMTYQDLLKDDLSNQRKMYRDGIIQVKAPRGYWRQMIRRLEADTGLDFKFTKSSRKADIICDWQDPGSNAGLARRTGDGKYKLIARKGEWYSESVAAHELGHALGLDHVGGDTSVMSYERDYGINYFMPLDLHAITHVFGLSHDADDFY